MRGCAPSDKTGWGEVIGNACRRFTHPSTLTCSNCSPPVAHTGPLQVYACLPKVPWSISAADMADRADFTSWRIFSIDPITARCASASRQPPSACAQTTPPSRRSCPQGPACLHASSGASARASKPYAPPYKHTLFHTNPTALSAPKHALFMFEPYAPPCKHTLFLSAGTLMTH